MAGLEAAPPSYTLKLSAEFVIEDGLSTKAFGIAVLVEPILIPAWSPYERMGADLLKSIVTRTSMLAQLATHPEDSETEDD